MKIEKNTMCRDLLKKILLNIELTYQQILKNRIKILAKEPKDVF